MPVYLTAKEKLQRALDRGILVDDQDQWLLEEYTWYVTNEGYAATNIPLGYDKYGERIRKTVLLHHCIMGQPAWEDEQIDHISQHKLDDRRCNLRYVTPSQQMVNRTVPPGNTGHKYIHERQGRYEVMISRDNTAYFLGRFDTLDEAAAERDEWLARNGG